MLMFTLATCLTTSNLSWFMDLAFQVPVQYSSLLSPPDISTVGHCFCFGSAFSFLLELFLHSSPVKYWTPTDLGRSFFSVTSFCLYILFMRFSRQECWSWLPFHFPMDHVLSELSTMTHHSCMALHGMAHSFIELGNEMCGPCDPLWSMWSVWLVFCDCGFHSVCLQVDGDKRLVQASWWEGLTFRKLGLLARPCSV